MKIYANEEFGRAWRPWIFLGAYAAAAALLASWCVQPFRGVWDALDQRVFFALNGSLLDVGAWAQVWAALNTRIFDVSWAAVMVALCIAVTLVARERAPRERLAIAGVIAAGVLAGIIVSKQIFPAPPRPSPSLVLQPFHDLRALYPDLNPKVSSQQSFPGDHGVASVLLVTGFTLLLGWRWAIPSAFVAVMNILPRLVGGGHWLSDVLVGGVCIALIILPWMIAAPATTWMERLTRPLKLPP